MTDDEWAFAMLDDRAYKVWAHARPLDTAAGGARRAMVYRMFAANGDLLYVGRTVHWAGRRQAHRQKPWWPLVASIAREWHETAAGAALAELRAIRSELPLHNIRHHPARAKRR